VHVVNEPLVVHDTIDDEVLVIRNDTGAYYSMIGPAADVWTAIRAGLDDAAIVGLLSSRYDAAGDELTAALHAFLAELTDALLIREGTARADEVEIPSPLDPRQPFVMPTLEVYTDMADLLLFDPIHEVTPDGWPNVVDGGA
jgi:hypothetical protein